ncbi:MAG: ATP-binding protein [Lachnospiraceae bacterium]|nr:ATP-binding protein [Lachnospiraceae bacterium]
MIGKYTLESLTSGMYLTPLDLYREYVQNAADSIDTALMDGQITKKDSRITITINSLQRIITIEDNGTGIIANEAVGTLVDIGNSKKDYKRSRGFRGIGRLSGLGYCKTLNFTTSAEGEDVETIVSYDCELLQKLLLPHEGKEESISEVIDQVISYNTKKAEKKAHYFRVDMLDVKDIDGLLNKNKIITYMKQNLPIPFATDFIWGSVITEKLKMNGMLMPEYNIYLNFDGEKTRICKPYADSVLSDRVRRIEDPIEDIKFRTFSVDDEVCAVLWYAQNNYYGTILDNQVKGIRVRHGNILFGDQNSLRRYFKEERFNGWICGELHICSDKIIPNSRRDDFERNDVYLNVMEQFKEWTSEMSKEIRSNSYKRSLDENSQKIIEMELEDKVDEKELLGRFSNIKSEDQYDDMDESDQLASIDFFGKLSVLANMQKSVTKYNALNISTKISNEQRMIYEKVFDAVFDRMKKKEAEEVVQIIIEECVS